MTWVTGLHRYLFELIERRTESVVWNLTDWAYDNSSIEHLRRKWWVLLDWLGWVFSGFGD